MTTINVRQNHNCSQGQEEYQYKNLLKTRGAEEQCQSLNVEPSTVLGDKCTTVDVTTRSRQLSTCPIMALVDGTKEHKQTATVHAYVTTLMQC